MKNYTRILLIIPILLTGLLLPVGGQQVSVSFTPGTPWSPGSWSRVSVEITGAGGTGPCRLLQEYPAGFSVRGVDLAGGDLFFDNSSLNIVWSVFPAGRSVTVTYEVMPERGIAGEIETGGYFYSVNRANVRSRVVVPAKKINVTPTAFPQQAREVVASPGTRATNSEGHQGSEIVYRVQVLSSSSRMSDEELKKRLGVKFSEKVTVIQSGNIFKYQIGECPAFDCAQKINEIFRKSGVEGSFIVAFRGDDQITIEQARSLQR